jgi:O-methyltransferase involved in polyketide biosynthesis
VQLADNPLSESERTAPISARNQRLTAVTNASNLKSVPVDLERQGLATALEGAGFQRKQKALVIREGRPTA